ncbi:MAG: VIT1/CCC1 transporter family protein [Thermaerobacter sp.]|nr:VIT1/CCC1 transporter family protein [Thermaerobacter sp.]
MMARRRAQNGLGGQNTAPAPPAQPAGDPKIRTGAGLVREAIFGVNDGLVATVGLLSGESLGHQPHRAIVIAGLSAVGAAMVSMAVGSYLATHSQNDFMRKQTEDQQTEILRHPDHERGEVRQLLREIGVPFPELAAVERNIVASRPRWLRFMMREAWGIHEARMEGPLANAAVMGAAVLVGSVPPIVPYLWGGSLLAARNWSWGLSLGTALAIGALKGRITGSSALKSAWSFAVLTGLSATVGALIGLGLGVRGG